MNVLMFPPTHGSGLGVQYRETAAALSAQRVDITVYSGELTGQAPDLIDLFDAPDSLAALDSFMRAQKLGVPILVHPVYWNTDRFYREGLPEADPPTGAASELERELRRVLQAAELAAQRVLFRHAAVLIAMSPSEADLLARDFGVARERVVVTTEGIDPRFAHGDAEAFRSKYGVRPMVLCAARVEIRKNQLGLIRALRDEPVSLLFAGQVLAPDYLATCQCAARGGRADVRFLPSLSPVDLAGAYAAAQVHALASWHDCVALTPLEAAVAGCANALSTECGARDYLGNEAHYFDPASAEEIRIAVHAALNTPASTTLRERLLRECTWTRGAEQTRQAYALAQSLGNPTDTDLYRADLEHALVQLAQYARLQEQGRAALWQEKSELTQTVQGYANGRLMRSLDALERRIRRFG